MTITIPPDSREVVVIKFANRHPLIRCDYCNKPATRDVYNHYDGQTAQTCINCFEKEFLHLWEEERSHDMSYDHPGLDRDNPDYERLQRELDDEQNRKISDRCTLGLKCEICWNPLCHFDVEALDHRWIHAVCQDCSDRLMPEKEKGDR